MVSMVGRERRIGRRRLLALGAGAGVPVLAGGALLNCSGPSRPEGTGAGTAIGPRSGGVLKSLLDEDPATLDPVTPSGGVGNQIAAFVYSRLVRFRTARGAFPDGTLEGDLALRWEQPEETTLIFQLREGVRFDRRPPTDGRPLTADDVVASWQAIVERGTYRSDLVHAVDSSAPIVSLTADGPRTVRLSLAAPDAQLLPTLASRFGLWVLPREAFAGGFSPQREMRGSGPWLLERRLPSTGFSFRRNPDYYGAPEAPLLDGVELPIIAESAQAEAQFRARNIHGGPALGGGAVSPANMLAVHRSLPGTRIDLGPPQILGQTIAFGWREGSPFRDQRVRQAASMLIDRDAMIDTFTNLSAFQAAGVPMRGSWTTPLSAGFGPFWLDPRGSAFGPSARFLQHDVAEARRLLAAAGYADGFDTPFTFIGGANWGRDWGSRAEALMAMLGRGGIRCKANVVDYNAVFIPRYLRSGGDFDGLAMQRTGSRGDPGQFWSIFFSSAGASSQVGARFPELDALILAQRRELEPARRIAIHHEIQRRFAEWMPAIPQGGHTEEPAIAWDGLRGPDEHMIWPGGDLGAEAYPAYWLEQSLR
jgi:peptide/nickel transport system substrate-binding protein